MRMRILILREAAGRACSNALAPHGLCALATWQVKNARVLFEFQDGAQLLAPSTGGGGWTSVGEYARGVATRVADPEDPEDPEAQVRVNAQVHVLDAATLAPFAAQPGGGNGSSFLVGLLARGESAPPPSTTARHLYGGRPAEALPSFESAGAVDAALHGAVADGVFDSTRALAAAAAAAASRSPPGVVVLGRGIYRIRETLVLPPGVSLVGARPGMTACPA